MARAKLIFYGAEASKSEDHELECFCNETEHIYISIDMGVFVPSWIVLDKPTAIKLVKTLKTEINKVGGSDE